jgi:hemerythrin-like domain-containing protein
MAEMLRDRRTLLLGASLALPAMLAPLGCSEKGEEETGAVEDLMREHGVLRRAILVFRESGSRLRAGQKINPKPLADTARLFRAFGEDYHERKLEEAHIFPAIRKSGVPAAAMIDVLLAQHARGRAVTDYILTATSKDMTDAEPLAGAFDALERMYAHHTAREDTVLFPAWKEILSEHELDEMGEQFEDIEKQQFGGDGFGDAVRRMDRIEQDLGLSDLAQFTAPWPIAR